MMRLHTGRRLHFGLFSPMPIDGLEQAYGGLGVMVDTPGIILTAQPSTTWQITGQQQPRVTSIVQQLKAQDNTIKPVALHVEYVAPAHQGWGTGTQLALAVAHACQANYTVQQGMTDIAHHLGRGRRSGIGIAGYQQGGFLVDDGKSLGQTASSTVNQIPWPSEWTFVLVEPEHETGLHAEEERLAFKQQLRPDLELARQLRHLASVAIVPAILRGDFTSLATALTDYNRLAGGFYRQVQPGDYSSPHTPQRIQQMMHHGAVGVGQSSWGPGLFALLPTREQAQLFCEECQLPQCKLILAPVLDHGAVARFTSD